MDSPFKLLVYAIFAIALLAIFYFIIWPLLAPANGAAEIERNLKASETMIGLGVGKQLFFQQGEGFSGQTFDTGNRSVSFQCNSAEFCCPSEEECPLAIEWDSRAMKFNESRNFLATTRCDFQNGLYVCRIYFGDSPAQIKIESLEMEEEFDLEKEPVSFEITIANTGGVKAEHVEAIVEINRISIENGKQAETIAPEYSKTEAIDPIKQGEKIKKTILLELNENGSFKAKIRASGSDAGFGETSRQFSTTGAENNCMPSYCEDQRFIEEKCTARCYCSKCVLGSECAEQVLSSEPADLGLQNVSFANAGTKTLGSNIADIIILDQYCESPEAPASNPPEFPDVPGNEPVPDPDDFSWQ